MKSSRLVACSALLVIGSATAATIPGDAKNGEALFNSQKCVYCHSVNGEGGEMAPDLAKRPAGPYTPSLLAAAIWNHAPRMWTAIEAADLRNPDLDPEESADLFAYFYAFRYFENAGDAGRGKRLFDAKGCVACHQPSGGTGPMGAPAITDWTASADAVQLARLMWNHAPKMRQAMSSKMSWPTLSAQEMTDILVYVSNVPGAAMTPPDFTTASAETGEVLFRAKGCSGCHTGSNSLEGKLRGSTLADLAAGMWNHAPDMRGRAEELRPEEMTRLVGYLWSIQYFDDRGDAAKGNRVLSEKGCNSCHGASAPAFADLSGTLDSISFVSRTWKHGPEMWQRMRSTGIEWPRFENSELTDLLAYLNSL